MQDSVKSYILSVEVSFRLKLILREDMGRGEGQVMNDMILIGLLYAGFPPPLQPRSNILRKSRCIPEIRIHATMAVSVVSLARHESI